MLKRTLIEIGVGLFLSISSLLVFFYLASETLEKELVPFDLTIGTFIYGLRSPVLTDIMLVITSLGGDLCIILATLVLVILLIKKHRKEAILFCLVLIIGLVLNNFFKLIFQIPRPDISPLTIENTYSFPSGHAMNSLIFYGLLAYFSYHFFRSKVLSICIALVAALLILLIGFSRVYLGVHHSSDVLAGYLAGFWVLVTALVIENILIIRKLFKKSE